MKTVWTDCLSDWGLLSVSCELSIVYPLKRWVNKGIVTLATASNILQTSHKPLRLQRKVGLRKSFLSRGVIYKPCDKALMVEKPHVYWQTQKIHNTKKALKLGYQFTLSRQSSLLVLPLLSSISNFQGLSAIPWSALNLAVPPNPTKISLHKVTLDPGFLGINSESWRVAEVPNGFAFRNAASSNTHHNPCIVCQKDRAATKVKNQWAVLSLEDSQRLWCILRMETKLRSAKRRKLTTNSTTLQVAKFQKMTHFLCITLCNSDLPQRWINII